MNIYNYGKLYVNDPYHDEIKTCNKISSNKCLKMIVSENGYIHHIVLIPELNCLVCLWFYKSLPFKKFVITNPSIKLLKRLYNIDKISTKQFMIENKNLKHNNWTTSVILSSGSNNQ